MCERDVADTFFTSGFPTHTIFRIGSELELERVRGAPAHQQDRRVISDYLAAFTNSYLSLFQQLSGDGEVSTMAKTLLLSYTNGDLTAARWQNILGQPQAQRVQLEEGEWQELRAATTMFNLYYQPLAWTEWRVWVVRNPSVEGYSLRVMQNTRRPALHFQIVRDE